MAAGKFRCNRPDCEPMVTAVRCRCIPMHERSGGQVKHCHGRTQIEPLGGGWTNDDRAAMLDPTAEQPQKTFKQRHHAPKSFNRRKQL